MKILLVKNKKSIIVKYPFSLKTVTSAFYNGGVTDLKGFFIISVDKNFNDPNFNDPYPEAIMERFASEDHIEDFAGFMTAVDLKRNSVFYEGDNFFIVQTLGLGNTCIPGERCRKGNTINTAMVYKGELSLTGAMDLFQLIVSSRTFILSKEKNIAGTSTDSVLVSFKYSETGLKYAGYATEIGFNAGRIIAKVTRKNIAIYEEKC